jgi:myosin heavy subunit
VNKGQSPEQVTASIGTLSRSIYGRCFNWLLSAINESLESSSHQQQQEQRAAKRAFFIGVLDIAGFEVAELNGFEQLCFNYTNERLQQFFNHFMFVQEQQEYVQEAISWEEESFGSDLQATIDLIDKPLGVFSLLDEECIGANAVDTKAFKEKLFNHHSQHSSFGKSKAVNGRLESDFDVFHYAGIVSYNVDGWLERNREAVNQTVSMVLKNSKGNRLVALLFQDAAPEESKTWLVLLLLIMSCLVG